MKQLFLFLSAGLLLIGSPHLAHAENPRVVINEIAWMGTEVSANDEWIELWNPHQEAIDITGWELKSGDGKIAILLTGTLEPEAFWLLERTDDTTVPELAANQIYTGAMKNEGMELRLFDSTGAEVDYVDKWHTGDNSSKATMQRNDPLKPGTDANGWCTDIATPNAPTICTAAPNPPSTDEPLPEATEPAAISIVPVDEEAIPEPEIPRRHFENGSVVFKSVLPNPDGTDKGNERIELRNRSYAPINLKHWQIKNKAGKIYTFDFWEVAPSEVITLFDGQFGFTLKNTADALTLLDPVENIIDTAEWTNAKSGQKIPSARLLNSGIEGTITRVIDGDTFEADISGQKLTVRLIGVDTPEVVHPSLGMQWYGKEASHFAKNILEGKTVKLVFENQKIDKYGRALAYVYTDELFINEEILKKGYGYAYLRFPFSMKERFKSVEEEAKRQKMGLWESRTNEAHVSQARDIAAWSEETLTDMPSLPVETPKEEAGEGQSPQNVVEKAEVNPECVSDKLVIEGIVPNPLKNTEEWIRIKNNGLTRVCLTGWQLDDALNSGSKPFKIQDSGIGPGGVRTYRKSETKISLNNTNDCAVLIDPTGTVTDKICYQKTKAGDEITHEGTTEIPVTASKKTTIKTSSLKPAEDPFYVQWTLSESMREFMVESVDEASGVLKVKLIQPESISISFANSTIDWPTTKTLLDLNEPVEMQVRLTDDLPLLTGIQQKSAATKQPIQKTHEKDMMLLMGFLLGIGIPKNKIKRLLAKNQEPFND